MLLEGDRGFFRLQCRLFAVFHSAQIVHDYDQDNKLRRKYLICWNESKSD